MSSITTESALKNELSYIASLGPNPKEGFAARKMSIIASLMHAYINCETTVLANDGHRTGAGSFEDALPLAWQQQYWDSIGRPVAEQIPMPRAFLVVAGEDAVDKKIRHDDYKEGRNHVEAVKKEIMLTMTPSEQQANQLRPMVNIADYCARMEGTYGVIDDSTCDRLKSSLGELLDPNGDLDADVINFNLLIQRLPAALRTEYTDAKKIETFITKFRKEELVDATVYLNQQFPVKHERTFLNWTATCLPQIRLYRNEHPFVAAAAHVAGGKKGGHVADPRPDEYCWGHNNTSHASKDCTRLQAIVREQPEFKPCLKFKSKSDYTITHTEERKVKYAAGFLKWYKTPKEQAAKDRPSAAAQDHRPPARNPRGRGVGAASIEDYDHEDDNETLGGASANTATSAFTFDC